MTYVFVPVQSERRLCKAARCAHAHAIKNVNFDIAFIIIVGLNIECVRLRANGSSARTRIYCS